MKLWVLVEFDYDDCWIVAVFTDEKLARATARLREEGSHGLWVVDADRIHSHAESDDALSEGSGLLKMSRSRRAELERRERDK